MQLSFDDLDRGTKARPRCKWCRRTEATGRVGDEGMVILGRCLLYAGTAYDRRCIECDSWEAAQ